MYLVRPLKIRARKPGDLTDITDGSVPRIGQAPVGRCLCLRVSDKADFGALDAPYGPRGLKPAAQDYSDRSLRRRCGLKAN